MAGRREVSTLEVRLAGDVSEALSGLNRVGTRAQKLGKNLRRTGYQLSRSLTGPILAIGAAAGAAAVKAAGFADSIDKASIRTGLAREPLQELKFAADQLGVGFDDLQKGTEQLFRRIPQIESGSGKVADAWAKLGISLRDADGELRPMAELFPEVIGALGEVSNETERSAIAMQLFGRRGAQLVPLMEAGAGGIEQLRQRARELGIVIGKDQVGQWVRFKDAMSGTRDVLRTVGIDLVSTLLPVLDGVVAVFRDHLAPAIRDVTAFVRDLDPVWVQMAAAVGAVAAAAGPVLIAVGSLTSAFGLLLSPAGAVVAGLAALAAGAVYVANNWDELRILATKVWMQLKRVIFDAVDGILGALEKVAGWVPKLGERIRELRRDVDAFADRSLAGSLESLNDQERALRENADAAEDLAEKTRAQGRAAGDAADATDDYGEALSGAAGKARGLAEEVGRLSTKQRRIFEDIGRRTRGEDMLPSEEFGRLSEDVAEGRKDLKKLGEEGEQAGQQAGQGLGDAFEQGVNRAVKNFEDLQQVASDILSSLKNQLIDTLISGLFAAGGPLGGLLGGVFNGLFGGGRQHGGRVRPGRAFLVGEAGPELFVPPAAGRIVPHAERAAARGASGGQPVVNVTVPPPDVSKLPPPMTPREAARDREWIKLMRATEREMELVRSERS